MGGDPSPGTVRGTGGPGNLHVVAQQQTEQTGRTDRVPGRSGGPLCPDGGGSMQRITHAQATTLLAVHTLHHPQAHPRGLTGVRGPGTGSLDLDRVLALREQRIGDAARRQTRRDQAGARRHGPPAAAGHHDC